MICCNSESQKVIKQKSFRTEMKSIELLHNTISPGPDIIFFIYQLQRAAGIAAQDHFIS
jgi:hypothetical protein